MGAYSIIRQPKMHPSLPVAIITTFNSYIGPPFLAGFANIVPICPVTTDWHSQNTTLTRMMLPIILGYALSIHKPQGNTSERIILNARGKEFGACFGAVSAPILSARVPLRASAAFEKERFQYEHRSCFHGRRLPR